MRRLLRTAVLAVALLVPVVAASGASATSWTSNGSAGGTGFTATAPAARFVTAVTSPAHSVTTTCSTVGATGVLYGPTGPVNTGPWNGVASWTPTFSGCSIAGLAATVTCATVTVNAISESAGTVSATGTGFSCTVAVPSVSCSAIVAGSIGPWNWIWHPGPPPRLFVIHTPTGATFTRIWPNTAGCNALMGTGASDPHSASDTFGSNANPPGNLQYTTTSAFAPLISHN